MTRKPTAPNPATGLHLWYVDLVETYDRLIVTTVKRDPLLATRKALALLHNRESEFYLKTLKGIQYEGTIDG